MMILYIVAYLYFLYVPLKRAMHMYQQNRYRSDRYVEWLKAILMREQRMIRHTLMTLLLCYGLFFISASYEPALLLTILVFIFAYLNTKIEDERVYRKPFVYTGRGKRLYGMCLLILTIMFLCLFHFGSVFLWILCTPYIYFIPWLLVLIVGQCMLPVEKMIQDMYVREAKKMLQEQPNLKIIGITGSYGKTSVKNILYHLLSNDYLTLMTPQSYNNRMGITLTIRRQLQALHEVFLCEMGADHVHDIEELVEFVKPSIGIVTAVGPQHLLTFHNMENILYEKMQLIEKLPVTGYGFLNADNTYIRSYPLYNKCPIIWFGKDKTADFQYGDVQYSLNGTSFTIIHLMKTYQFQTKLLGEHNVMNICASVAVSITLGMEWEFVQTLVQGIPYVEHRLEKRETAVYTILDDAYNSNPDGARFALEVMKELCGKRILVTPGFIDLGDKQEKENYRLGLDIVGCIDEVILVGKQQTKNIQKGLLHNNFPEEKLHIVTSIKEAFEILTSITDKNSVVLLENDLPDAFNH